MNRSFPRPPQPLPPAPWETGKPVVVPLNRIADYLTHHRAKLVEVRRPRRPGGRFVAVVTPEGEGQKQASN